MFGSLSIYFMLLFKVPNIVCNILEMLWAQFFWEGYKMERKICWIKWETMMMFLDRAGIGWQFLADNGAIWVKMIKSMHGSFGGRAEYQRYLAPCFYAEKIGDGVLNQFWKDIWVGYAKLMDHFPRLYTLEVNKDCVIADKCRDGNWEWYWIR
uniref:Reverse transcriptase zinc-binding domain-containing protein n=1 Tax=Lactuca sativa TaxID=4236 RepID=A0A9R1VNF2_LACSA|nr:hypothetical protein LSAT_V11C400182900 [Lactuca sativa]